MKLENLQTELTEYRENGIQRGHYCGYEILDEIYTAKKGYPLFIAGAPHSGKTEITMQLLLNWSQLHGWKHFCYFGENGTPTEVYADLCFKLVGKPYLKKHINKQGEVVDNPYAMDEAERVWAEQVINEHFFILDLDTNNEEVTIEQFYKRVEAAEFETDWKFDTTTFDPFNDLVEELAAHGGREDKYFGYALKVARTQSKKSNRIDILVNHIASVKPERVGAVWRMRPAFPNEWAGGQVWHRRAFTMLLIFRPGKDDVDEAGEKYGEGVVFIVNQKAKPKGSGNLGTAKMFFDWKTNQYYELGMGADNRCNELRTKKK
jgi:hypothetical protein